MRDLYVNIKLMKYFKTFLLRTFINILSW